MNEGVKYDDGKLRYDLIPQEVIDALAKIMTMGAGKYAPDNWKFVEPKERYFGALMRHLADYRNGYRLDDESGESHLAHALTCLSFLFYRETCAKQQRIYIASPYTIGDKMENVRISMRAGDEILNMGHVPYLPLLSHFWEMESAKPYETWLALDLVWLRSCDALVRLPGESSGADREVEEARKYRIPVYFGIEELKKAVIE